jgi:hypothetical protein
MIAAGEDTVCIADKTATSIHMNKTEFAGQIFFYNFTMSKNAER